MSPRWHYEGQWPWGVATTDILNIIIHRQTSKILDIALAPDRVSMRVQDEIQPPFWLSLRCMPICHFEKQITKHWILIPINMFYNIGHFQKNDVTLHSTNSVCLRVGGLIRVRKFCI